LVQLFLCRTAIQESAKTTKKTVAKLAEENRKREFEKGYNAIEDRKQRIGTLAALSTIYLKEYRLKHRAPRLPNMPSGISVNTSVPK
jgi:hypothetical protein